MSKTVCFTGHRDIPAVYLASLPVRIDSMLGRLYAAGFRNFIAGGADGFDTMVASRILSFRESHPDICLHLALPYVRTGSAAYRRTLDGADKVTYIAKQYRKDSTLERDRYMVDHADVCVAFYLDRRGGGTYYTVRYANERGVPVVNLAPKRQALME